MAEERKNTEPMDRDRIKLVGLRLKRHAQQVLVEITLHRMREGWTIADIAMRLDVLPEEVWRMLNLTGDSLSILGEMSEAMDMQLEFNVVDRGPREESAKEQSNG
jgi:hypothetical protein